MRRELGYNVNMKARGLRLSRSGLAVWFFPTIGTDFLRDSPRPSKTRLVAGALSNSGGHPARPCSRGECHVKHFLSQRVELLFIAGVRNPTPLNELCSAAGVPSINLDLPGDGAPSVVPITAKALKLLRTC